MSYSLITVKQSFKAVMFANKPQLLRLFESNYAFKSILRLGTSLSL